MIAQGGKSNHNGYFIGRSFCLFLFQANIDQKGCHKQYMDGVDPGACGMGGQSDKETISVIDEDKQAQNKQGPKGPDGHIRPEKGDHKEQGSDE